MVSKLFQNKINLLLCETYFRKGREKRSANTKKERGDWRQEKMKEKNEEKVEAKMKREEKSWKESREQ